MAKLLRADHAWAIQLINSIRCLGDILAPTDRFSEQSSFFVCRFDDLQSSLQLVGAQVILDF